MGTIRQPKLTAIQQSEFLRKYFPQSTVIPIGHNAFNWKVTLQPTALSEQYDVRLEYRDGKDPDVYVVAPKLQLAEGATLLQHVYDTKKQRLCIYHKPTDEWDSSKLLGLTVVPWISEWLLHYELWVITGEWHGEGYHFGPKKIANQSVATK